MELRWDILAAVQSRVKMEVDKTDMTAVTFV